MKCFYDNPENLYRELYVDGNVMAGYHRELLMEDNPAIKQLLEDIGADYPWQDNQARGNINSLPKHLQKTTNLVENN